MRITRKIIEQRLTYANRLMGTKIDLEYNQHYGYRFESMSGDRTYSQRMSNLEAYAFIDGMLLVHEG